jgi:hypothetical protein
MNVRTIGSNVYYLPLPAPPATDLVGSAATPRSSTPWRRWRQAWWRLRVAVAEIRAILRPRRRYCSSLELATLLEGELDAVPRRPARRRPARVIDFERARLRRQPAQS